MPAANEAVDPLEEAIFFGAPDRLEELGPG